MSTWISDPQHIWQAVYRITVLVLLLISIYMRVLTLEDIAEVKGIVIENSGDSHSTPTP